MVASQDGWFPPSALVKLADTDPIAPLARHHDPDFVLVTTAEHYDGVYYYAMAVDPLARGTAHTLIDQAAYRYGHPMHGWFAHLLSLGQPQHVPEALLTLGLLGMFLSGWSLSRLSTSLGGSPWLGVLPALSPGLLFATAVDTTETMGAGLVLTALLAWRRERWGLTTALIVLCCLHKEQYVSVPVGLALWELLRAVGMRRLPTDWDARLLAVATGPAALAAWYAYARSRFGMLPATYEPGNIGRPVDGWLETFRYARQFQASGDFNAGQIGSIVAPVLIGYVALFLVAIVVGLRRRTPLVAPLILMAAITSAQGWRTLLYPHEIFRTPAVATLLAAAVIGIGLTQRRGRVTSVCTCGTEDAAEGVPAGTEPAGAAVGMASQLRV